MSASVHKQALDVSRGDAHARESWQYTVAILLVHWGFSEKYFKLKCCPPAGLEPTTEGNFWNFSR